MSLTLIIVIFTSLISYQALNNANLFHSLKHHPYAEHRQGQLYRMVTSGFVHGDLTHLFVNMFVLWNFGEYIEAQFVNHYGLINGRMLFLTAYLAIILLADIPSFISQKDNYGYSAVGASGGTSGIIMMFILLNPWSMLYLFFAIPIPAIIVGVGYLWYSTWASKNQDDRIDHSAHLWGAVAGIVLGLILLPFTLQRFLDKIVEIPFFN